MTQTEECSRESLPMDPFLMATWNEKTVLGQPTLTAIAYELLEPIPNSVTIDWFKPPAGVRKNSRRRKAHPQQSGFHLHGVVFHAWAMS